MINLPAHLRKYIDVQNYEKYTPIDQACWRFILKRLKNFLSTNAHSCYLEGLEKTGIDLERIPKISEISAKLEKFGWRALPVSGFIPPAAFMELQSLSVLPIASDMRSLEHLEYTPAPDIVHEAAGHAPILVHPEFAAYLKQYAQVAKRAIISFEDLAIYDAIRWLSDIKENPQSTPEEIELAQQKLNQAVKNVSHISEATLLGRMNWWTAEYGLIGSLENPKIFGAGLLSSVGESQSCLTDKVKKLPLTVNCIETSYDITEQQPQLFVAKDFAELSAVLEQMSQQMSYRQGGAKGLQKALLAKTVNTVELDSGLQISGELETFLLSESSQVSFVKFKGPVQLSHLETEIQGHSVAHHSQGFSSPLGSIKGFAKSLSVCTLKDFESLGIISGKAVQLEFDTGFRLAGQVETFCSKGDRCLIISFINCTVTDTKKNTVHFKPEWGVFDLALGDKVVSVFGGPADRARFPITDDFVVRKVIPTKYSNTELDRHDDYQQIRSWRESQATNESLPDLLPKLVQKHLVAFPKDWLFYFEALELTKLKKMQHPICEKLHQHLIQLSESEKQYSDSIIQGLEILNS